MLDEGKPVLERIEVPIDHPVPAEHTNAYCLGNPPLLVDPAAGPDDLDIDPDEIEHVAVTHTHPDHVGGLKRFRETSDAIVWAVAHHQTRFHERTGVKPDRTFREGDQIGDTGVRVVECPGHSPEHVVFLSDGAAIIGDLARRDGSVMVGVPDGDMRAYLTSLRRLLTREIETAYPGHGPPIEDPTARFASLLAHRLEREHRVEAAVTSGARTVQAIVERAYDKDLRGVETAAARTVEAHLEKLAVEGRVSWDGRVASRS